MNTMTRRSGWSMRQRKRTQALKPPPVPVIAVGSFKGRKVSDLADDELQRFLKVDARRQPGRAYFGRRLDARHYWYALYEVEKRRTDAARTGPEILDKDGAKDIAYKLVRYAFRVASKRCHSDQGGSDDLFCRLKEAEAMLLQCIGRNYPVSISRCGGVCWYDFQFQRRAVAARG